MHGELITEGPLKGWHRWHARPIAFADLLGGVVWKPPTQGHGARVAVETGPQHGNLMGKLHGGFLLAFLDFAMIGVMRGAVGVGNPMVTVQASMDFLEPGEIGQVLEADGRVVKETGRLVFVEGMLRQEDRAIARFNGILRKVRLPA